MPELRHPTPAESRSLRARKMLRAGRIPPERITPEHLDRLIDELVDRARRSGDSVDANLDVMRSRARLVEAIEKYRTQDAE